MPSFTSFIFISLSCLALSIDANGAGFSVDIIHRDSPKSPFYNPKETSAERIGNAFRRSMNRVRRLSRLISVSRDIKPSAIQEEMEMDMDNGGFFMSMSIGTPPKRMHLVADTGSDLIWTQCTPCPGCPKQADTLFDPKRSSTYKDLNCVSRECRRLENKRTCSSNGICRYESTYGDGTFSKGNLAVETVTLNSTSGRPVSFPRTVFGCSHSTNKKAVSGIVGLGGGRNSLIRQMGSSIGGKFSYCLIPMNSTTNRSSTLKFGSDAVVSGKGVKSTPLITKELNTFYLLTLKAISIENKRIKFQGSHFGDREGNIAIDSGSILTVVPPKFFYEIASVVERVVGGKKVKDPNGVCELCYAGSSVRKFPQVIAHFKGADVKIDPLGVLIPVPDYRNRDVLCFPVRPDKNIAIFGNAFQSNSLIGYDLVKKTAFFKSKDCTKA